MFPSHILFSSSHQLDRDTKLLSFGDDEAAQEAPAPKKKALTRPDCACCRRQPFAPCLCSHFTQWWMTRPRTWEL